MAQAYSKDTPISLSVVLPILLDSFKTSGFKSFCKSSIPMVKSYVCLSDCDGHGTCNNGTNTCQCDPFWMPSPFIHQTNCAWVSKTRGYNSLLTHLCSVCSLLLPYYYWPFCAACYHWVFLEIDASKKTEKS